MSFVKYGNCRHADNEVMVTMTKDAVLSSAGLPVAHEHRWQLEGFLFGNDSEDLTTKIRALEEAYSVPGRSLGLYIDDKITAHSIEANQADSVQVLSFNFPEGNGAEYSTFRKYQIVIGATVAVEAGKTDRILSFHETLRFSGRGGPINRFLPTLNGPWQKQQVSQTSTVRCVQAGSAVGFDHYPFAPSPMFPGDEHQEQSDIQYDGPQKFGLNGAYRTFGISWQYNFESVSRFSGRPNVWTV